MKYIVIEIVMHPHESVIFDVTTVFSGDFEECVKFYEAQKVKQTSRGDYISRHVIPTEVVND